MRLKIENWLIEQKISSKAEPLFEEAIKSYKASAYKASLLFSYLGFMTILKERILRSTCPPGIPIGKWTKLRGEIQNRESWDKKVFEASQTYQPAPIFPIPDSIRREVEYWKDRRNDCAHFKHEKIDFHHVESFWSFLESNYYKFVVNGGRAALISDFKDFFDVSLTPPDAEITPLIINIQSAIEVDELTNFYAEIESEVRSYTKANYNIVFNEVLENYSNIVAEKLIEYLKEDNKRLVQFIRNFPDKIQYLSMDEKIIRELWYTILFSNHINDFHVFTGLLRNNLIRKQDIHEANGQIISRLRNSAPDSGSESILESNGFYKTLRPVIFEEGGIFSFSKANNYSDIILHYIDKFGLDEEIVKSICGTFSNPYKPKKLSSKLKDYFSQFPEKKKSFNDILNSIDGLSLPSTIQFLMND